MAEEPDNMVLVMLRRIDDRLGRIEQRLERIEFDVHDLKLRLTQVEEGRVGIHRRPDRLEERIEKRFDLVGSPAE